MTKYLQFDGSGTSSTNVIYAMVQPQEPLLTAVADDDQRYLDWVANAGTRAAAQAQAAAVAQANAEIPMGSRKAQLIEEGNLLIASGHVSDGINILLQAYGVKS